MVKLLYRLSGLNPRTATAHLPTFEFLLIPSWDLYIPFLLSGQGSTLKMATSVLCRMWKNFREHCRSKPNADCIYRTVPAEMCEQSVTAVFSSHTPRFWSGKLSCSFQIIKDLNQWILAMTADLDQQLWDTHRK
jgi:hypothetical protein